MIKLPDNWKDCIQLRNWLSPVNSYGEVAVLIFALKNKDGQTWLYQENNSEFALTGASFNGLDTFATDNAVVATDEQKTELLSEMYARMIYHIPAISVLQDTALEKGIKPVPITNDDWEYLPLAGLTLFKEI